MNPNRKGENNPNWGGGRIKSGPYILRHCPNHPNCDSNGYVMEHRLKMESHIGRLLDPKEVVHHEDNTGHHNQIKNLKLFKNNKEHHAYHKKIDPHYNKGMLGQRHSEETKEKMSNARKGEKNYFYGKQHTEETKRKISKANSGIKRTEEFKRSVSKRVSGKGNPIYGKKRSEETKRKISETLKKRHYFRNLK